MSLSNPQVISLLNRHFVPVYLANEDYRETGSAPPEEKAELRRIHREGHAAKLSVGTVHAYVLRPDGRLTDSLHVAEAAKATKLIEMLQRSVQTLGTPAGEPLVKPAPQAPPPSAPGGLVLKVVARYLERRGDRLVLVENAGGNWSAFPGVDWVKLERAEAVKLLPPGEPRAGATWDLDREAAARILTHFYPPTENNDLKKNRIDEQSLRGTVESVAGDRVRARLEGALRMKHPFYHKDDDQFVRAPVAGTLEWDRKTGEIRALRLVTDQATYGPEGRPGLPFGVAVRSVPAR